MEERRRKIARARQTRRDAEKDGSRVRRINIYIYIDLKIEQAPPRQSNHRERKASRSGNVPT